MCRFSLRTLLMATELAVVSRLVEFAICHKRFKIASMDERCRRTHAKLLAGTCPWCGHFIVAGKVEGQQEERGASPIGEKSVEQPLQETLQERVTNGGVLSSEEAISVVEAIANELAAVHRTG